MSNAVRYTTTDISAIASTLTHNTEHRVALMAAILSNPSVVVTPPPPTTYPTTRPRY